MSQRIQTLGSLAPPSLDSTGRTATPGARSLCDLLAPLEELAAGSPRLLVNRGATFTVGGETWELPRFVFVGPKAGEEALRLGIFAGIHGDEPEGVYAVASLLRLLCRVPELVAGYHLLVYPVCNPTGFVDRTRNSRGGRDLNREFWQDSQEPEVQLLEAELKRHRFQGLISLHTDSTSDGFYGFAQGAFFTRHLVEPALAAAEEYLPLNRRRQIDGFEARNGIIRDIYPGVLSAPPKARPRPFEITLETPEAAPAYLKEAALIAATQAVLVRYREFIAYAPNL